MLGMNHMRDHDQMLVAMQDMVNEMNKMNRVLSHPLCINPEDELASQVTVYMRTLGVGFPPQTRRRIK